MANTLFHLCSFAVRVSVLYSIIQCEKVDFNQIQYGLRAAVCWLQMCVCFSESAWRLAFSWAPHRVLGNKYGNLSMRASLLSACFCLLLGLVKYHFSINTLISNCTIGASATDYYLRWCVDLENVFLHKLSQFVQSCSYAGTVMIGFENDLVLEIVCY